MLSGTAPVSAQTISPSTSTATPITPPRISRLLGLGYFRSYTGAFIDQPSSTAELSRPALQSPHSRQNRRRPVSLSESSGRSGRELCDTEDTLSRADQNLVRRAARNTSSASEAPIGGWLPIEDSLASPTRSNIQVQPDSRIAERPEIASAAWIRYERENEMTRHRSVTSPASPVLPSLAYAVSLGTSSRSAAPPFGSISRIRQSSARAANITTAASSSPNPMSGEASQTQLPISQLPSIRFVPYNDSRSSRPSLVFPTITRTLPNSSSGIRVGRYSEKESAPLDLAANAVSDAPVGFKSKVVSRRHCEFFYMDNQWYIKDVKSSSGTFLNHIRLSPPGEESKPFAVKDGDLIQLGIDFKGGEEMIFRCVKIRILCNRGWQKSINKFNKSAHKQLNELQRSTNKEFKESTECTICLNSIAPCQSLFVAPCSHTWHYKCIRPMLEETSRAPGAFGQFLCPNCRALADLEADVEEGPLWEDDFSDGVPDEPQSQTGMTAATPDEASALLTTLPLEDLLSTDLDSLPLRDQYQHPSFGLPPASTSVSRSGSTKGLNPSASSFVPTSSSALPLPSTPVLLPVPLSGIPSIGPEPLETSQPPSASNTIRLQQALFSHSFNGISLATPEPSQRHAPPYEDDTVSSPDSDADGDHNGSLPPLDTLTISPHSIYSSSSLHRRDAQSLAIATRQHSNGDAADAEGPMTPRNNAGPFVFDGAAGPVSTDSANSRASGFEDARAPISLNEAATM